MDRQAPRGGEENLAAWVAGLLGATRGAPSLKKDLSYGHGLAESPKLSFEKDSVVLCCDYNYNCLFCSFCFFSKMASYKDFH